MTSQINSNSRVLADITIKLKDGSVADSTKVNGKPSWIILGNGSFSDEFENRMIGAKVGDELTFELPAKDAFGEANPDNIHFMDISQFPKDIELNSGAIISFEQAGGGAIPGIIRDVKDSSVTVDFNHPLAGKTVVFEIAVLQIEE